MGLEKSVSTSDIADKNQEKWQDVKQIFLEAGYKPVWESVDDSDPVIAYIQLDAGILLESVDHFRSRMERLLGRKILDLSDRNSLGNLRLEFAKMFNVALMDGKIKSNKLSLGV